MVCGYVLWVCVVVHLCKNMCYELNKYTARIWLATVWKSLQESKGTSANLPSTFCFRHVYVVNKLSESVYVQ